MEQIKEWLILIAFFFVLFFLAVLLLERHRKNIRAFLTRNNRLSTKIPRDAISKIFCLWACIHFLKKMVYFVPFPGIIQTKFSLWWVDKKIPGFQYLMYMFSMFILFLVGGRLVRTIIDLYTKPVELKIGETYSSIVKDYWKLIFLYFGGIITIVGFLLALKSLPFVQVIFSPLLLLKMLCSGKYLGLLTSLAAAYLIIKTSQKLKPKITGNNAKFLIAPGIILLGFLIFSSYHFPGDWDKRFQHKIQAAKSKKAFGDLLDAGHSIKDNLDKSNAFRLIALAIAESGDITLAKSAASIIPNEKIKNRTLKQLRGKIKEQ